MNCFLKHVLSTLIFVITLRLYKFSCFVDGDCPYCDLPGFYTMNFYRWVTRWRSWLRHWATNRKVAGSIPDGVIGIFHWYNPSGPGVDSASNTDEYQEYFLGGTGGRCVGLTTFSTFMCRLSWNLSLSLLEPSGPVQACNGIALPFTLIGKHRRFGLICCLTEGLSDSD